MYTSVTPERSKLLYSQNSSLVRKVDETQKLSFADESFCRLSTNSSELTKFKSLPLSNGSIPACCVCVCMYVRVCVCFTLHSDELQPIEECRGLQQKLLEHTPTYNATYTATYTNTHCTIYLCHSSMWRAVDDWRVAWAHGNVSCSTLQQTLQQTATCTATYAWTCTLLHTLTRTASSSYIQHISDELQTIEESLELREKLLEHTATDTAAYTTIYTLHHTLTRTASSIYIKTLSDQLQTIEESPGPKEKLLEHTATYTATWFTTCTASYAP